MPGSFRIGNIAGIDIDINGSWIIILVLLTGNYSGPWLPGDRERRAFKNRRQGS